jgi:hypothetical protein
MSVCVDRCNNAGANPGIGPVVLKQSAGDIGDPTANAANYGVWRSNIPLEWPHIRQRDEGVTVFIEYRH